MILIKKRLVISLLIVLHYSYCKGGDDGSIANDFKGFTTYTIDLKKAVDSVNFMDYVDVSQCDAVVLESKDGFLIGEIQNIAYRGDTIIIVDAQTKSILLFDKNGKALSKICRIGRGRGEYASIHSSYISDDKIFISDIKQGRIVCYDFKGKLISAFDCLYVQSLAEYNNTLLAGKGWFGALEQGNLVNLHNIDGSLIKKEIPKKITESEKTFQHGKYPPQFFIAYPGNLSYWVDFDDMVFKFRNGAFEPYFKLEYANKIKAPRSAINKGPQYLMGSKYAYGYVWFTNSIFETSNFIIARFDVQEKSQPSNSYDFIVDKATGKTLLTKRLFDGDLFSFSGIQDGDYFITYLNGSFVQYFRRVCKDADTKAHYVHLTTKEFLKLTEGISETDNGIIVRKKVK